MKLSAVVKRVIELAQKVEDYYERELPKCYPQYPLVGPGEKDPPAPSEEEQLRKFLKNIPEEMVFQLVAIMRLGRGNFKADDFADRYEALKSDFDSAEDAALQMTEMGPLADYLAEGLAVLKREKMSLDKLPGKGAKSVKSS